MAKIIRDDIDRFFQYNIDLTNKTLYIGSLDTDFEDGETGTDHMMASYVIKGLHILDNHGSEPKTIKIIMNNPGGDIYHGFAIYDAIQSCKNRVEIKVFGHAMSMGSVIFQAADDRVMAPNSRMMLHYGTMGYWGHSKDYQRWSDEVQKLDKWMEDLYLEHIKEKHPKFTRRKLHDYIKYDYFLTADEAVELGLADRVE